MKKRRLNKRGKILATSLTFTLSVVIYVLMAILGAKGQDNIFYQVTFFAGYGWLFLGQIAVLFMIWGNEVSM